MSAPSARAVLRRLAATAAMLLVLGPALASAATIISFQPESYGAFQAQLANGEVKAITFNKVPHTVHITLKDGEHLLAVYPPSQYKALSNRIRAAGIPILIEHPNGKPVPVHHKLRYIAAAVLVILIVVVVIVLMVNRRRSHEAEEPSAGAAASPAAGPPPAD